MNLLALETSSEKFSITLKTQDKYFNYDEGVIHQTSQNILPVIKQLLSDANISLKSLDAIVLGKGPGSFTGLRIAFSVAQALAFVLEELSIILISSLRACAQAVFDKTQCPKILVAMNAYKEEIYLGIYQKDNMGFMQEVVPDSLIKPNLLVMPDSMNWLGVGNAFEIYEESLRSRCGEKLSDVQIAHYPTAEALIKLGEVEFSHKNFVSLKEAVPIYLRENNAWEKKK